MSGIQLRFGDDGEFRKLLLERWEQEGKRADSFDHKVWRWLIGGRPARNPAEQRFVRTIRNWAFNTTANMTIHQQRKARGYYLCRTSKEPASSATDGSREVVESETLYA
jgi:hypothetical protein